MLGETVLLEVAWSVSSVNRLARPITSPSPSLVRRGMKNEWAEIDCSLRGKATEIVAPSLLSSCQENYRLRYSLS